LDRYSIPETGHRLLDKVPDIHKEVSEYVDKVKVMVEETCDFIRGELYRLAEWISGKT